MQSLNVSVNFAGLSDGDAQLQALTQSMQAASAANQSYGDSASSASDAATSQASALGDVASQTQLLADATDGIASATGDYASAASSAADAAAGQASSLSDAAAASSAASDSASGAASATLDYSDAASQAASDASSLAGSMSDAAGAGSDVANASHEAADATREHGEAAGESENQLSGLSDVLTGIGGTALPGMSGALSEGVGLLGEMSEAAGPAGAGIAALTVTVGAASEAFNSFIEDTEQIHQLSLESGMAAPAIVGLQTAMQSVGVSGDSLQRIIAQSSSQLQSMQNQLDAGKQPTGKFADALKELGVNAVGTDGQIRSLGELMPEIMDAFQQANDAGIAPTGQAFNAAGVAGALFGTRIGGQLIPLLDEGKGSFQKFTQEAANYGIGSEGNVQKLEQWNQAQAELHLEMRALTDDIGSAVAPAFLAMAQGALNIQGGLQQLGTEVDKDTQRLQSDFAQIQSVASDAAGEIQAHWSQIAPFFSITIDEVSGVLHIMIDAVELVANDVSDVVGIVSALLRGDWAGAWHDAEQLVTDSVTGIKSIVSDELTAAKNVVLDVSDSIGAPFKAAWDGMKGAVEDDVPGIVSEAGKLTTEIPGALESLPGDLLSMGANLMESLAKGIADNATKPIDAIKDMGDKVIHKGFDVFHINSPSQDGIDMGSGIDEGIAKGITDSTPLPVNAATDMGHQVAAGAEAGLWSIDPTQMGEAFAGDIAAGISQGLSTINPVGFTLPGGINVGLGLSPQDALNQAAFGPDKGNPYASKQIAPPFDAGAAASAQNAAEAAALAQQAGPAGPAGYSVGPNGQLQAAPGAGYGASGLLLSPPKPPTGGGGGGGGGASASAATKQAAVDQFLSATSGQLSIDQLVYGLLWAGVPQSQVVEMAATVMAESGGVLSGNTNPTPVGPNHEHATGLGQFIQSTWSGTMPGTPQGGATAGQQLQAIARLFGQQGFGPWEAGPTNVNTASGFVGQAQQGLQDVLAGKVSAGTTGSGGAGSTAQPPDYTSQLDSATKQLATDQAALNTLQTSYNQIIITTGQVQQQQVQIAATGTGGLQAATVALTQLGSAQSDVAVITANATQQQTQQADAVNLLGGATSDLAVIQADAAGSATQLADQNTTLAEGLGKAKAATGDLFDGYMAVQGASHTVTRGQVDNELAVANAIGLTAQAANLQAQTDQQNAATAQASYVALLQQRQAGETSVTDAQIKDAQDLAGAAQTTADISTKAAGQAQAAWGTVYKPAIADAQQLLNIQQGMAAFTDKAPGDQAALDADMAKAKQPTGPLGFMTTTQGDQQWAQSQANAVHDQLLPALQAAQQAFNKVQQDIATGDTADFDADNKIYQQKMAHYQGLQQAEQTYTGMATTDGQNLATQAANNAAFKASKGHEADQSQLDGLRAIYNGQLAIYQQEEANAAAYRAMADAATDPAMRDYLNGIAKSFDAIAQSSGTAAENTIKMANALNGAAQAASTTAATTSGLGGVNGGGSGIGGGPVPAWIQAADALVGALNSNPHAQEQAMLSRNESYDMLIAALNRNTAAQDKGTGALVNVGGQLVTVGTTASAPTAPGAPAGQPNQAFNPNPYNYAAAAPGMPA